MTGTLIVSAARTPICRVRTDSLGHLLAAPGARMAVTVMQELRCRRLSTDVVLMRAGGGLGSALLPEID